MWSSGQDQDSSKPKVPSQDRSRLKTKSPSAFTADNSSSAMLFCETFHCSISYSKLLQFSGGWGWRTANQPLAVILWKALDLWEIPHSRWFSALPSVIPTSKNPNLRLRKGGAEGLAVSGIHSLVSHLTWILSDTRGLQPTAFLKLSSYMNCHLKIPFKWLEVRRKTIKHGEFCCWHNAFDVQWPHLSSDLYLH